MTQKPILDLSHDAAVRRVHEADRRLAGLNIPTADRPAARRTALAQVESEELSGAAQLSAQSEAATERQRIAAIVKAGVDLDVPQQALRLALLGPVNLSQAAGILPSLSKDRSAPDADRVVPGFLPFAGESAATANERRRVRSIFAHSSAQGRFTSVCAVALYGDNGMPHEAATALLSALPIEAAKARIPSIAERAAGAAEFGPCSTSVQSKAEASAESWRKAVAAANASLGAGAASPLMCGIDPAAPVSSGPLDANDPLFGLTPEGRAAAIGRAQAGF